MAVVVGKCADAAGAEPGAEPVDQRGDGLIGRGAVDEVVLGVGQRFGPGDIEAGDVEAETGIKVAGKGGEALAEQGGDAVRIA